MPPGEMGGGKFKRKLSEVNTRAVSFFEDMPQRMKTRVVGGD